MVGWCRHCPCWRHGRAGVLYCALLSTGVINAFSVVEDEVLFRRCFLGGGMDGSFNSGFEACTELRVTARFLTIHTTLGKEEFGDGVHPYLAYIKWAYSQLLVKHDKAALAHCSV